MPSSIFTWYQRMKKNYESVSSSQVRVLCFLIFKLNWSANNKSNWRIWKLTQNQTRSKGKTIWSDLLTGIKPGYIISFLLILSSASFLCWTEDTDFSLWFHSIFYTIFPGFLHFFMKSYFIFLSQSYASCFGVISLNRRDYRSGRVSWGNWLKCWNNMPPNQRYSYEPFLDYYNILSLNWLALKILIKFIDSANCTYTHDGRWAPPNSKEVWKRPRGTKEETGRSQAKIRRRREK